MENTQIVMIISIAVLVIVVFLLLREFFAWYSKRNEQLKNDKEIIRLLKKLINEDSTETKK